MGKAVVPNNDNLGADDRLIENAEEVANGTGQDLHAFGCTRLYNLVIIFERIEQTTHWLSLLTSGCLLANRWLVVVFSAGS